MSRQEDRVDIMTRRQAALVLTLGIVAFAAREAGQRVSRNQVAAIAATGPTADSVRQAAYGPAAETCPPEASLLGVEDSIQAAIDQSPPGSSFCIQPGVHRLSAPIEPKNGDTLVFQRGAVLNGSQLVTDWSFDGRFWVSGHQTQSFPKEQDAPCEVNPVACEYEDLFMDGKPLVRKLSVSGLRPGQFYFDEDADKIYVRDVPRAHRFEATITPIAIVALGHPDVTVRGATIEKFAYHGIVSSAHWVLERNEIRYCHSHGLKVYDGTEVTNNYIHHNGDMGVFGYGDHLLFQGNQFAFNNYLNFGKIAGYWHAGASKIWGGDGTVVRDNWSHHNIGDGWWFDTDNVNVIVERNLFEYNARYGLFYEASQRGVIQHNVVNSNRQGGVWVSASRGVEVANNDFEFNDGFSLGISDSRDDASMTYGVFELSEFHAHDNVIKLRNGQVGVPYGFLRLYSSGNRFESNHYYVGDVNQRWWRWLAKDQTWLEWQSAGNDLHGTLQTLP
jgi:hypothetical protein